MKFTFLYQAERHIRANQWSSRRLSQSTIRCDFDLELLRRGIKGRFEILGHGAHPFQQKLNDFGMIEDFYGHTIQIEEPRNAVWFKLNYDNIGKKVTKYIGGWRDLDPNDLDELSKQYQEVNEERSTLMSQTSTIRYQQSYVASMTKPNIINNPLFKDAQGAAENYSLVLRTAMVDADKKIKSLTRQMEKIKMSVTEYMESHKS